MAGRNEKYHHGELFRRGAVEAPPPKWRYVQPMQIILFLFVLWNQLSGSPRLGKATLVSLEYLRGGDRVGHP